MRIGFIGEPDASTLSFAKKTGFEGLEVFTCINSPLFEKNSSLRVREDVHRHDLAIFSFFNFENYCTGNRTRDKKAKESFRKTLELCTLFDAPLITCNAFAGPGPEDEQLKNFQRIFTEFAQMAGDHGVRVGIENCPHDGRNIAYSPELWERLFEIVPPDIGLEFDPSHLLWMGIDYIRAIYDFQSRIYMFHAKDTEVYKNKLRRTGILGKNWWEYRIPGRGEVDWKGVFQALSDIGYEGDMVIEHEDPDFEGDAREKGLELGLALLREKLHILKSVRAGQSW